MPEVLVVDDSPAERFKCKELLESLGYEVVEAENGRDGVAMANQELPDVVLMDIVMPGMKGFQATRQICRGEKTSHIPVIIVSGKDQETDKVWGRRQGAQGYLIKPVDKQKLSAALRSLLLS
ncbi:MAG: response regulator [SAR86 cluster bacterium]|uniref:Response regulator n=1 Tax=SAR86 cluster bacterium TaxID=2030880 RepID=A0A972W0H9_9GAMM|nr:response regulator [SAR86 cluster bacterium]